MMARLRWRRVPRERGLRAITQGWRGYELRRGTDRVLTVDKAQAGSFYWYGLNRNTLNEGVTFEDVDCAKAHAMLAAKKAAV